MRRKTDFYRAIHEQMLKHKLKVEFQEYLSTATCSCGMWGIKGSYPAPLLGTYTRDIVFEDYPMHVAQAVAEELSKVYTARKRKQSDVQAVA